MYGTRIWVLPGGLQARFPRGRPGAPARVPLLAISMCGSSTRRWTRGDAAGAAPARLRRRAGIPGGAADHDPDFFSRVFEIFFEKSFSRFQSPPPSRKRNLLEKIPFLKLWLSKTQEEPRWNTPRSKFAYGTRTIRAPKCTVRGFGFSRVDFRRGSPGGARVRRRGCHFWRFRCAETAPHRTPPSMVRT